MYFLIMIHAYNNIFAFTSFGVTVYKEFASTRKGVHTLGAQRQNYDDRPSLVPPDNNHVTFNYTFFIQTMSSPTSYQR